MVLLPEIKEKTERLLDEVKSHPEHRLGWMKRRDFYQSLGKEMNTASGRLRAWLVFFTAQRVLALFEQGLPDVDGPRRTLEYTERFLSGELSIEKLDDWEASASIAVGTGWGTAYGPKKRLLSTQTVLSGLAVAHVVAEITLGNPFRAIHLYSYKGPDGKDLTGDQWSDEKLGKSLAGDTASSASMAEAYDLNTQKADPVKLLKFWEWWLTDAIDEAWEKADGSPIKFT